MIRKIVSSFLFPVVRMLRLKFKILVLSLRNRFSIRSVQGDIPVILSVTSHGFRIQRLWLTLESVAFAQDRPERVIVWLDESLQLVGLPHSLKRLAKRGIEFRFVKDVGPHQKYYYAVDEALRTDRPLVTMDDDCIYPNWWLQTLYKEFLTMPNCINCYRARLLSFNQTGKLVPYNDWPYCNFSIPAANVFFTGVSGVIYPVTFLQSVADHGDRFKEVCPKADDIWLNYIAAKMVYPARQIYDISWDFPTVPMTQHMALWTENSKGGNDIQINMTYDLQTLKLIRESNYFNK